MKYANCATDEVLTELQRLLAHGFGPSNIEVLAILRTDEGRYQGDPVCTVRVMTTTGPISVVYYGHIVEGETFFHVTTVPK